MPTTRDYAEQLKHIEDSEIIVMHDITGYSSYHKDILWSYLTLIYNHRGVFRALYDMQESVHHKNEISCVMPGHLLCPLESSDDYLVTIMILSQKLYKDLLLHVFSHDYDKFNLTPISPLSEEQAQRLMSVTQQIEAVAAHTEKELPNRHNMLIALLSVGYEYLNLYRREQDKQLEQNRQKEMLNRFCDLVVEHYRESHEVKFYAEKMHLTPKYFSKVITSLTGGISPADWIKQYIVAQAKHLILAQKLPVKEVAFRLGFSEPASFCRFFKRVTGITPQAYRRSLKA